jgi:hypothetical protein
MGLDMYLTKKYYIGGQYEHRNVKGTIEIETDGVKIPIALKEIEYIECYAAQWRKANQIHQWFVDNVQRGEDDCKKYDVSREQLKELLDLCIQIKENPELEHELLPTQEGFFFGGTDYDECYFADINETIEQLSKFDLTENGYENEHCEYYYQSSW